MKALSSILASRRPALTRIETLETRIAPATFIVNTIADTIAVDGFISLREALVAANTNAASGDAPAGAATGDEIIFAPALNRLTITLGGTQLAISDDVRISGEDATGALVDVTISGNNLSRIFQIDTTESVTLDGLRLTGGDSGAGNSGGAINIAVAGDVNLSNMTITGNKADVNGGGVFNNGGALVIDTTVISNNEAFGTTTAQGGGGLYSMGGTVRIFDSTFSGNKAMTGTGNGGAIFSNTASFTISGSDFTSNQAARAGGGIEVTAGTMSISDSKLLTNTTGINGGGLHISGAGRVVINGGEVKDNVAGQEGGGLWNSATGTLYVRMFQQFGTMISGNTANGDGTEQGGGGIFNDGGLVSIKRATISGNISTAQAVGNGGGGIFNDGKMILDGVSINFNQADAGSANGGGILNSNGGVLTVNGGSLVGNTTARAGGGIENNLGVVTLNDVELRANTAGINGGGLHISGSGLVTMLGCMVTHNIAGQEGGGLWNSANGILRVVDAIVSNNTANGNATEQGGGGIFNDGGVVELRAVSVTNNSSSATANGNGGGGIFNDGTMSLENCLITGNSASAVGGADGGGILNSNGGTLTMTLVTIRENAAARAGGGIENNGGTVIFDNGGFFDNTAGINGGGLHTSGAGNVSMTKANIFSNEAGNEGGGLWNSSTGTMTVTESTVRANSASFGGGIHNDGGTLTLMGTIILNNDATNAGGGLNVDTGTGLVKVINSTIGGNESFFGNGGGVRVVGSAILSISNSTIAFNAGGLNGGGIFAQNASVSLISTLVAGNDDSNGPGDVFRTGGTLNVDHSLIQTVDPTVINGTNVMNLFNVDAQLDSFAFSLDGSVILPASSPAINAGSNPLGLATDSVGSTRTFGIATDIGAFEQTTLPPQPIIAYSSAKNDTVFVADARTGNTLYSVQAFGGNKAITKGVSVATGDVNGDGVVDLIVAATASKMGPAVRVFDGITHTQIGGFMAFEATFKGGVYVGSGDLDGDGRAEIVVGAAAGKISGPNVKAFTVAGVEVGGFSPYGDNSAAGARVAVGDVNGDGFADIITGPDKGTGAAHVKVFSGQTGREVDSFLAYGTGFTKGVSVAAGDVNGDGIAEIITGHDAGKQSTVRVFSRPGFGKPQAMLGEFFGFATTFRGGVRVAAADVDGDGKADLILGSGKSKIAEVQILNGLTGNQLDVISITDKAFLTGVFVG